MLPEHGTCPHPFHYAGTGVGRCGLLREEVKAHPIPFIGVADVDAMRGTCKHVQLWTFDRRVRPRSRASEEHDRVAAALDTCCASASAS